MENEQKTGILASAAKIVGAAAGKIASITHLQGSPDAPTQPGTGAEKKSGKLPKKNKSRLPRLVKKEMKKKAAASAV